MTPRLDEVPPIYLLRNAVHMTSRYRKTGVPLWAIVRDLCGVGSGSAQQICVEMGWNPHQPATHKLK